MPESSGCGEVAVHSIDGLPSYTTTRSARYVAMMKSCSTMKAVFLACMMYRLMTLEAEMRCSESRYADGSSIRYRSAGFPSASTSATRCSSPPERYLTSWSSSRSISIGFITSVLNCGWMKASRIFLCSSSRTVPSKDGAIFCGLYETFSLGTCDAASPSGARCPANILMKVVLPVPFSPSMTRISEPEKEPASTCSVNVPSVFVIAG
mmetsp:Transcript_44486/g.144411  ORF Transcript_44486/g.144411 Transcript_44486/m.144411 type:complete len:208 (-) Transcript_44486:1200-1823(-)